MTLKSKPVSILSTLSLALLAAACSGGGDSPADAMLGDLGGDYHADIIGTDGRLIGDASLTDGPNGVLFKVDISGLSRGWHGIHLHQVGDCSDFAEGFKASGSHINPDGNQHGLLNPDGYERADMPNLWAGSDGRATASFFNSYVRASAAEESANMVGAGAVLMDGDGFAIVIHENPDDHLTQPIGGAGARVGCAAFTG